MGVAYVPDADGNVEVPEDAVTPLKAHGYEPAPIKKDEPDFKALAGKGKK